MRAKAELRDKSKLLGRVEIHDTHPDGSISLVYSTPNTVLYPFKDAIAHWLADADKTLVLRPEYIAAGLAYRSVALDPADASALEQELWRQVITDRGMQTNYEARLEVVFASGDANGWWKEVGLIDSDAPYILINTCNAVLNWTYGAGSVVALDTAERHEGTAAIKHVGNETVSFRNAVLSPGATTVTEADGYLRFWYQIDADTYASLGNLTVELSSSSSDDTSEYQWTVLASAIASDGTWNFIDLKLSDATKTGTPNIDSLVRFRLYSTKGGSVTERLDHLSLFEPGGTFFCRTEISPSIEKQSGEVRVVHWFLRIL